MTSAPVTVVVPTIGRPRALARCLDALRDQAAAHGVDVVCVFNDTPPDAVPGWVRRVYEPHRSVGLARNRGVDSATTDWVAFTDDDCIVPPSWLSDLCDYIARHPTVAVAGGAVVEPERAAGRYRYMAMLNYMRSAGTMKTRPTGVPSLGAANLLVRRSAFLSLDGFNPTLPTGEDYDLLVRARRRGLEIGTYLDAAPVIHAHTTGPVEFVRRYWGYGRGVAAVVDLNGLDPQPHRIYSSASLVSLLPAIRRFAADDRAWISADGGRLTPSLRAWAVLRAAAWQAGAWVERRRRHRAEDVA